MTAAKYRYRGFEIGYGTDYIVNTMQGFSGFDLRTGDKELPRSHGQVPGLHLLDARRIIFEVVAGRYEQKIEPLLQAFSASKEGEFPLEQEIVNDDGSVRKRTVYARVIEAKIGREPGDAAQTKLRIGLKATDPRVYGDEHIETLPIYTAGGSKLDYVVDYPKDFSTGKENKSVVNNGGTTAAYPTIEVIGDGGDTTRIELVNTTNGSSVEVTTTIADGQRLTIRMSDFITATTDTRIIELDGANRYGSWTNPGEVFYLSPGDNTIRVNADGFDPKVLMRYDDTFEGATQ